MRLETGGETISILLLAFMQKKMFVVETRATRKLINYAGETFIGLPHFPFHSERNENRSKVSTI